MAYPKGQPAPNKGKAHSEETRKKISESCKKVGVGKWNKGKKVTWTRKPVDKSKNKVMNKGHKGHKQTPEWCKHHSERMKEWWSIPENRARMLPSPKKGKKLSLKTRQKISAGNKGKSKTWLVGIPRSQEVKDKISKKHKGRKFSKEHRKKISLANSGKPKP